MSLRFLFLILLTAITISTSAFGQGTILWDESVNGPLSNDGSSPTGLGSFQIGTNSMLGATEYIPNGIYGDYFTFSIPGAAKLDGLWLAVDKPVAVWLGSPDFGTPSGAAINPLNGDLLSQLGLASLGNGAYGMYIKNYDLNPGISVANYHLDFFVQSIPEPTTVSLMLMGSALAARACRWKSKKRTGEIRGS